MQPPPPLPTLTGKDLTRARSSVLVFLLAAVLVVVLGLFPGLRPTYEAGEGMARLDMAPAIMIVMLAAAGIMVLLAILLTMNAFAIWLRNRYQRRW